MKYSDILKNEHFINLAAIIRAPFWSGANDPGFWQKLDSVNRVKTPEHFASNKQEFVNRFCELLISITQEPLLSYSEDDLAWFVEQMDSEFALPIASLLLAYASAPDEVLTCQEVADATGTAASAWRNKAADGDIPGAVKKGKTWLFPRSVLRGMGLDV